MGAPNVHDTPTATAAVKNWCLSVLLVASYLYGKLSAMQPAIWTNGPSLPKERPVPSIQIIPEHLARYVLKLSIFGNFSPAIMAFI